MKKIKKLFFLFVSVIIFTPAMGQYGRPTYHDSYADFYLMGGYQRLYHPTNTYNVGTLQAEILFSFAGSRVGITYGPNYISYSPVGLILFVPAIFIKTMRDLHDSRAALLLMLPAISAMQFHIPLSDHLEISAGWDALKFTKLKNYDGCTYITGSLNAGLICFLGDQFFLSGYYEYNHTHNFLFTALSWLSRGWFSYEIGQPSDLNGHSFGVRIGYMF